MMRKNISLVYLALSGFVLAGCLAEDIAVGVMKMTEPLDKKRARVEAAQNRSSQAANSRKLSYRKNCEDYGYILGTPDFNQCLASERRDYEQKQAFQEMKYRDDAEIHREKIERKRQRKRERDCAYFSYKFLHC